MNKQLEKPFIEEENIDTLSQMCPMMAPDPDGLSVVFYQKHWHMVKARFITTCLYIFNMQGTIAPLNHKYIALIPKTGKPRKVNDFRSISLSNVIYRIAAKPIANRLK